MSYLRTIKKRGGGVGPSEAPRTSNHSSFPWHHMDVAKKKGDGDLPPRLGPVRLRGGVTFPFSLRTKRTKPRRGRKCRNERGTEDRRQEPRTSFVGVKSCTEFDLARILVEQSRGGPSLSFSLHQGQWGMPIVDAATSSFEHLSQALLN